jgi:hypothetical protein
MWWWPEDWPGVQCGWGWPNIIRVKSRFQYPGREKIGSCELGGQAYILARGAFFMLFDVLGGWHEMSAWGTLYHQSIELFGLKRYIDLQLSQLTLVIMC